MLQMASIWTVFLDHEKPTWSKGRIVLGRFHGSFTNIIKYNTGCVYYPRRGHNIYNKKNASVTINRAKLW